MNQWGAMTKNDAGKNIGNLTARLRQAMSTLAFACVSAELKIRIKKEKSAMRWRHFMHQAGICGKCWTHTAHIVVVMLFLFSPAAKAELPAEQVTKIVDAIYLAEGGAKAKYGIKSVSCTSLSECRQICENTVRNNYRRWLKAGGQGDYLEFLANRYAPAHVHPLNKNWLPNVRYFLAKGVRS